MLWYKSWLETRWRFVIGLAILMLSVMGICEPFLGTLARYSLFGIMDGERYFHGNGLPWLGLLASAALSAAMLVAASRNLARQDF